MNHTTPPPLRLLERFHREQRGTALTEFCFFLPVWSVILIAIFDMNRYAARPVVAQAAAQSKLWTNVFQETSGDNTEHMIPVQAGLKANDAFTGARQKSNKLALSTTVSQGAMLALVGGGLAGSLGLPIAAGHMGEGQATVNFMAALSDNKIFRNTSDIMKDRSVVGLMMVDSVDVGTIKGSVQGGGAGAAIGAMMSAVGASGLMHSKFAGIRYGSVYGDGEIAISQKLSGNSFTYKSGYDCMVGPKPLISGGDARTLPFLMHRLAGQTKEEYQVALHYGESEWDTTGTSMNTDFFDGLADKAEKDAKEEFEKNKEKLKGECESSHTAWDANPACKDAGYTRPDPPPPPPPPNPPSGP